MIPDPICADVEALGYLIGCEQGFEFHDAPRRLAQTMSNLTFDQLNTCQPLREWLAVRKVSDELFISTSRERFKTEREAVASFSPTLFIDFATVFVYGELLQRLPLRMPDA